MGIRWWMSAKVLQPAAQETAAQPRRIRQALFVKECAVETADAPRGGFERRGLDHGRAPIADVLQPQPDQIIAERLNGIAAGRAQASAQLPLHNTGRVEQRLAAPVSVVVGRTSPSR